MQVGSRGILKFFSGKDRAELKKLTRGIAMLSWPVNIAVLLRESEENYVWFDPDRSNPVNIFFLTLSQHK